MANKKDYFVWDDVKWKHNISCLRFDKEKNLVELHLRLLMEAIDNVKTQYMTYSLDGLPIPDEYRNNGLIKHTERVFAYELYYQWSKLIDKRTWVINAEIRKDLEFFSDNIKKSNEIKMNDVNSDKRSWNFPDLVLHKGQNKNGQMIACEIKRIDRLNVDFVKDIETLYWLTRSDIIGNSGKGIEPYRSGVFLLLNGTIEDFKSIIKVSSDSFKEKNINLDETRNIICVYCNRINNNTKEIGFQSLFKLNQL